MFTTLSRKIETISGEYFEDCQRQRSSQLSYDLWMQKQLWQQTWNDLRTWLTNDEIEKGSNNIYMFQKILCFFFFFLVLKYRKKNFACGKKTVNERKK